MFVALTHDIQVTAQPSFLADQSNPEEGYFVWAYTIQIENKGVRTVQLISRRWHITDAGGQAQEVEGPGVVGEQPVLVPGQVFQYTSGVVLYHPSGIMTGAYEMINLQNQEPFSILVPTFSLDSPFQTQRPN